MSIAEFDHDLKILPTYFAAVVSGNKPFEIRKNDRDFQTGQRIIMRETVEKGGYPFGGYQTGRYVTATVGYMTEFAQRPGYVVFGLLDVEEVK